MILSRNARNPSGDALTSITRPSRHEQRNTFDEGIRITLLEGDMDKHEFEFKTFKAEVRADIKWIKGLAFTILGTLCASLAVLVVNIAAGGG